MTAVEKQALLEMLTDEQLCYLLQMIIDSDGCLDEASQRTMRRNKAMEFACKNAMEGMHE